MTDRRAIQVGDLVMMVRCDHKCCAHKIGYITRVEKIPARHPGIACQYCGQRDIAKRNEPIIARNSSGLVGSPQRWYKRIPPLDELESSKTDEPMKEPA